MKEPLKVLICASECNPIVKVGGLGDVIGSLPKALRKLGVDVRIVLPFYKDIDTEKFPIERIQKDIKVPFDGYDETINIYQTKLTSASNNSSVPVYLIKNKQFISGGGIYFGADGFVDSKMEIERFAFFSKAVLEFIKHYKWKPDVAHCNDWHTGIIADLTKLERLNYATVFTIHNLANQGIWDITILSGLQIQKGELQLIDWDVRDQNLDMILQGIIGSDIVNTVSPTYAKEIMTPEFGEGLEDVLRAREGRVHGILNGIDYELFNPETDGNIEANYSAEDGSKVLEAKTINKEYLQKRLGLKISRETPLIGMVTRIAEQKGFDILIEGFEQILNMGFQFVLLGLGDQQYQEQIKEKCDKFAEKCVAVYKFDASLAQQIYSGSDVFLMPSRFEPCGLGQMIAMRYGTPPVVRAVGGLKDSVIDSITGFTFSEYTTESLLKTLGRVCEVFQKNKDLWQSMIETAMRQDFSWYRSAKEYVKLYEKALEL